MDLDEVMEFLSASAQGISYPKEMGTVATDFSAQDDAPASLYVIDTDDNPRDFMAAPKTYGVFWSAKGPDPVNRVAISLWPHFGKGRDSEYNIDGSQTRKGECYDGFACLNYGSTSLCINVKLVESDHNLIIDELYRNGLLQKALELRGVSTSGVDKDSLIQKAKELMDLAAATTRDGAK